MVRNFKTVTESIKCLGKLTMLYNIIYAQNVKNHSWAEMQRSNLASHLSTWNKNTTFFCTNEKIHIEKKSTCGTQVALAPSVLFVTSGKSFVVQDVLKVSPDTWIQNWRFLQMQKSLFFQYVKTTPHGNVTHFTTT